MAEIALLDTWITAPGRLQESENWYSEPFSKRTGCETPGQCGDDCNCDCPYNTMTEIERLPLIGEIAKIFPNEWLAFITSPEEDDDYEPQHGKLIAHSPNPDEVYDAVNTVLWNQHVYIFFNGDFEAMQSSYGEGWDQKPEPLTQRIYSGPNSIDPVTSSSSPEPLPDDLTDLICSAVDNLYDTPNLNEAIRRLRLARVKAAAAADKKLIALLDSALDKIETPLPRLNEIIWHLEEGLIDLDIA